MADKYPLIKVGELAESISETHKKNKDFLIFLNTSDVLFGKILHRNYSAIEHWPGQAKKSVKKDDILFSEIRPENGRWAYVDENAEDFVVSTKLMVIRTRQGKMLPRFLFCFLTAPETTAWLQHLAESRSGTFPQITFDQVSYLEIPIPPLPDQHAIAHILGTLDDKIELNRRMNETLEAMARALFKSWFVDFDPVRAKIEGRDTDLPPEISDLFPEEFEDSELGEIPKGWEVQSFGNTVNIIGGGTPKTSVPEYWGGDIPWFSVVDAPSLTDIWVIDTEKKITQEGLNNSSTKILETGTTIISARGTVGRLALVGTPMAMNQSCYGLQSKVSSKGYFTFFSTEELVERLRQNSHGSVFDTITRETFSQIFVPSPGKNLIDAFEKRVSSFVERMKSSILEMRTLSSLRDTLLPKLISGEIRVEEAEKYLEVVET